MTLEKACSNFSYSSFLKTIFISIWNNFLIIYILRLEKAFLTNLTSYKASGLPLIHQISQHEIPWVNN